MATVINRIHDVCASPGPPSGKMATLVIATRHEIEGAGIEALLRAAGHRVVASCSHEDDLLSSSEAYRPHIVMLAENVVGQKAAKTVSLLRTRNRSVAIIFLIEERDAMTAVDLLDLDVEGILLSGTRARGFTDCVESVSHGRKWVDPNLLRHLAMAERPPPIASSLTSREGDIAHLVARGLHNKEIARGLHLSEGTVKMHLHHIYEKLHLGGRTQLALSVCTRMPVASIEARPAEGPTGLDSVAAARVVAGRN